MKGKCRHPDCYVPDTSCVMGNRSPQECEHWAGGNSEEEQKAAADTSDPIVVPWSGGSLGLSDVAFVGARGKSRVVGLIGPQNAGKTTFLAAIFLLLSRFGNTPTRKFAGSYTLRGWEQIASHLKWAGSEPPRFPPHTTSFDSRTPGLLHIALRGGQELEDLLFVDAPGEWFREWAFNREAPGAEGARWVAKHADVLLIFADCAALSGETRGEARVVLRQMIDRLGSERRGQLAFLIWSKSDIAVSKEIRSTISRAAKAVGSSREFELSVYPLPPKEEVPEHRFLEVIEELTSAPMSQEQTMISSPIVSNDNFLNFRGSRL